MESHCYIDSCVTVDWAVTRRGTPAPEFEAAAGLFNDMIEDPATVVAISEMTLLETLDVCGRYLLRGDPEAASHDEEWYEEVQQVMWTWIASGELIVLASPPNLTDRAMRLIRYFTKDHSRQMRAFDAAHLVQCSLWALDLGRRVTFVTSDSNFGRVLSVTDAFDPYIEVVDLRSL